VSQGGTVVRVYLLDRKLQVLDLLVDEIAAVGADMHDVDLLVLGEELLNDELGLGRCLLGGGRHLEIDVWQELYEELDYDCVVQVFARTLV